jgi:RNA recognition motif-containing protein
MTLYVGNLPYQITENELQAVFSAHGTVSSVKIIRDKMTGRSKGFGFVEMPNDAEGQAAVNAVDGQNVNGRPLKVNEAREKK